MKWTRHDAIWIAIILAVGLFVAIRANGRALDPIIDTGRDLYIPEQIRAGTKLYRDILYYYPPLAPYVLAAITAITGSSLASYTGIGIAIALATAAAMYALARSVAPAHAAGTATLLFVSCSVYSISGRTSNYFFPYAHAATLSMLFFVSGAGFLACWSFVDRRARWLAPGLACLVAAAWTKLEFVLFAATLIAVVAIVHRIPLRWIGGTIAFALLSLIAVDRYFSDAPAGRHWLADNVLASSLLQGAPARYFYRQVSGFDRMRPNVWAAVVSAVILVIIILLVRAFDRWSSRAAAVIVAILIGAIAFGTGDDFFRGWALLQIVLLPFALRRPKEPLLLLLVVSLCASSRVFLRMTPAWYGFVFLVPVYALIAFVLFEWLPSRNVYSRRASFLAVVPIVVVAAHFLWLENGVVATKRYAVPTPRGTFYDANLGRALALEPFFDYVRTTKARSFVVVPEGLTLNYLTKTKTSAAFHTFTPVETASAEIESQIMADFAAHPPEYVVVVSRNVSDFGYRGFGLDYDRRFAALVQQHYAPVKRWRYLSFELIVLGERQSRPQ